MNIEKFWDEFAGIMEQIKVRMYIIGDFNSRVGIRDDKYETIIGKQLETAMEKIVRLLSHKQLDHTFYDEKFIMSDV